MTYALIKKTSQNFEKMSVKMPVFVSRKVSKLRSRENLGHINTKTVHDSFFDQKGVQEMYIFDLFTNNLLSCGHLFAMDEKNKDKDFDLILVPFSQEWEKTAPKDYKTLKNECMNPNVNSKEYINVTKGIKIITIYYESII